LDRGVVDEGEGVVVDTLVRIGDREIGDRLREDGDGDLTGISTFTLVVVNTQGYGIGSWLIIAVLRGEAVVNGRAVTKIPFVSSISCDGISREILEDEEIVIKTLGGIVDRELGFGREIDNSCFGERVDTTERGGYFELNGKSIGGCIGVNRIFLC
jgi:hypothetical protein